MKYIHYLISSFILLAHGLSSQANYFVSPIGNDGNTGTAPAQAWKTIQHAMDEAIPNSTVHIMEGNYLEKVEVNVSGTQGNPIRFVNHNDDEVTIEGTGITSQDAMIAIYDKDFIIIEGLTITNNIQNDAQGIIVEGSCKGIEIRNNVISNIHFSNNPNDVPDPGKNSQPIIVYGTSGTQPVSDLTIEGNMVFNCRTGYSEGIAVNGNIEGFEIIHNRVFNLTNIGIDIIGHEGTAPANDQARNGIVSNNLVTGCKSPYATAVGIYVDGGRDIVIERNEISDCQWGIEIGCEAIGKSTSDIVVRNNMIYFNDDSGMAIGGYDYPSGSGKVEDCLIMNNTTYGNDIEISGTGGVTGELTLTYTENCTLQNNVFYTANQSDFAMYQESGSVGLVLDYNLYFSRTIMEFDVNGNTHIGYAAYQSGTGQDPHSINLDPLLADPGQGDLQLTATSPAINAGNPDQITFAGDLDFEGQIRVDGDTIDIGADEYVECPQTQTLEGIIPAGVYASSGKVIVNGIIQDGSNVMIRSSESELIDGFEVEEGAVFEVVFAPCE